jgi:hypothetical protein
MVDYDCCPAATVEATPVPSANTNYSKRMSKHANAALTTKPSAPSQSMKRDRVW